MADHDRYENYERERRWRERDASEGFDDRNMGRDSEYSSNQDWNRSRSFREGDNLRDTNRGYGSQGDRQWNRTRQWRQNYNDQGERGQGNARIYSRSPYQNEENWQRDRFQSGRIYNQDWYNWDFDQDYNYENDFYDDRIGDRYRGYGGEFDNYRGDPSYRGRSGDQFQGRQYRVAGMGSDYEDSSDTYQSAGMRSDYNPRSGYPNRWNREDRVNYGQGDIGYDREGAFYQDLDEPVNYRRTSTWAQPGKFTGMGPRNYKRSDERIRENVCELLSRHGRIDARNIEIDIRDGEVTLKGTVPNREMKRMAEDTVETITGIKDVQNEIKVVNQGRNQERGYRSSERGEDRPYSSLEQTRSQGFETRAETSPAGSSTAGAGLTDKGSTRLPETETTRTGENKSRQLSVGMEVVGSNGLVIGRVKEVREADFLIDREMARDVYAPFSALESAGEQALLNIPSDEVDNQGWPYPPIFS